MLRLSGISIEIGFVFISFLSTIAYGQSLTVMTYNIKYDNPASEFNSWDNRKESLVKLIAYYHPAILGTQEGLFHQLEYMDSALVNYTYFGKGRDDGKKKGEFSAIFYDTTEFSVEKESTFWLSETMNIPSYGWGAQYRRICTYGLFKSKISGERFWVFNVHYDHEVELSRINSSKLILNVLNEINSENLPLIVMGDFNSQEGEVPMQILSDKLSNSYSISRNIYGPFGTYNGFDLDSGLDRRIDHILVQDFNVELNLTIDDRRSNNLYISDHFPIFMKAETKKR